jgi:hypothetical protein
MSLKRNLFSFIKSFDFFGESYSFKIHQSKYYTSVVGGITSLAFLIYSLYYFFLNLNDFFSKNVRLSAVEKKTVPESSISFMDHSYFNMAFCIRDSQMAVDPFLAEKLIQGSYALNNHLENKRLISERYDLPMERCTNEHFIGNMSDIYSNEEVNGCQCINFAKNADKGKLRSKYNLVDQDTIQYYLKFNDRSNSTTDVVNYLQKMESKLFVYFPSFEVDSSDTKSPFKMNVQTKIYDLHPYSSLKSEVSFSVINFTDFSSLIYNGKIDYEF